jgi:hypothetical protein
MLPGRKKHVPLYTENAVPDRSSITALENIFALQVIFASKTCDIIIAVTLGLPRKVGAWSELHSHDQLPGVQVTKWQATAATGCGYHTSDISCVQDTVSSARVHRTILAQRGITVDGQSYLNHF